MNGKMILVLMLLFSGNSFAAGKDVKVSVNGMVCGFCAQGITKKFKAEDAVANVDVKLADKMVTISLKDKQDLPDDRIKSLLQDSGYTVEKIERN